MENETKKHYGVWLYGEGWLDYSGHKFASDDIDYARQSLKMCLPKRGEVKLIDDSLVLLEGYFLEQEKSRKQSTLLVRIVRLTHGIFRPTCKQ